MKLHTGQPLECLSEELLSVYPNAAARGKALQVGNVLASLGMTDNVVSAGFLANAFLSNPEQTFPTTATVNAILQDLMRVAVIDKLHDIDNQNIESLRQMLLAVVKDVRVVVIKLVLELVQMRHLDELSEAQQKQHAAITKDIFAPLANRLGIAKIKWEMEDLALRCLEPNIYRMIASSLAEQRKTREAYVNEAIAKLHEGMLAANMQNPLVYGRVKHINSIYAKMLKKHKHLEQIYDLLAIRVQVETVEQCYEVMDLAHKLWTPITSEYDDYIANPKPNGYQSLHTAVIGPSDKTIEIQIRTHEMHEYAELGVAAHWKYKEGTTDKESAFDKQINWLRQILAQNDESLVEEFKNEILEDRVYVITPQGQVINLPDGATPLDFAYYIHTELGHRCRGALIDDRLVPIDYCLQTGETVEVLTSPQGKPSRDWLNPQTGFIKTARARSKARSYFRKLEKENALAEGKTDVDNVFKQFDASTDNVLKQKVLERFNVVKLDDLYMGVGIGDISLTQVRNFIKGYIEETTPQESLAERLAKIPVRPYRSSRGSVMIEGIDDLFVSIATCCRPIAPDAIVGFITKTKGVSIHKKSCPNLIHLQKTEPERILEVEWALGAHAFIAAIEIRAEDRYGLLKDIMVTFSAEKVMLNRAEFINEDNRLCVFQLDITVSDQDQLQRMITRLSQLKSVVNVKKNNKQ